MKDTLTEVNRTRSEQKVCEANVAVPTVIVDLPYKGGEKEVFVQWFAEFSETKFLKRKYGNAFIERFRQMQFPFPVPSLKEDRWFEHPERFKVVLFGQLKDWPKKEVENPRPGNPNSWILWVTSSYYGGETPSGGNSPASFYILLGNVVLVDRTLGLITPKKYCDTTVLDQERDAYQRWAYN